MSEVKILYLVVSTHYRSNISSKFMIFSDIEEAKKYKKKEYKFNLDGFFNVEIKEVQAHI